MNSIRNSLRIVYTIIIAASSLEPLYAQSLQGARSLQGSKLQPSTPRWDQSGNSRSPNRLNFGHSRVVPSPIRKSEMYSEERLYRDAFSEYPALRQVGSPIRREFVIVHSKLCERDPNFFLQDNWPLLVARKASENLTIQAVQYRARTAQAIRKGPDLVAATSEAVNPTETAKTNHITREQDSLEVNEESAVVDATPEKKFGVEMEIPDSKVNSSLESEVDELKGGEVSKVDSGYSTVLDTQNPNDKAAGNHNSEELGGNSGIQLPFTQEYGAKIAGFAGEAVRSSKMVYVDSYQRGDSRVDGYTRQPSGGLSLEDNMKVAAVQVAVFATIATVEACGQWLSENEGQIGRKTESVKREFLSAYEHYKEQTNSWFK